MTTKDLFHLVSEFSDATVKHHKYTLEGDWQRANIEAKKIDSAFKHIIKLEKQGREALLALTEADNAAVASMAATYSLKYAPEACIKVLSKLAEEPGLLGFEASQALKRWKEGTWSLE